MILLKETQKRSRQYDRRSNFSVFITEFAGYLVLNEKVLLLNESNITFIQKYGSCKEGEKEGNGKQKVNDGFSKLGCTKGTRFLENPQTDCLVIWLSAEN
jgi:hypothetical protein